MIKVILLLLISFSYLISYDNEDKYTKLHLWSVNTYFTFNDANTKKAGKDGLFFFLES